MFLIAGPHARPESRLDARTALRDDARPDDGLDAHVAARRDAGPDGRAGDAVVAPTAHAHAHANANANANAEAIRRPGPVQLLDPETPRHAGEATREHASMPRQEPDVSAPGGGARPVARIPRGGVVTLPWSLRTGAVRRCYRRDYPAVNRWLAGLERTRHFRTVSAERCDAATRAITDQVTLARGLFDEAVRRHDGEVAAAGFADVPFHDPGALTVAAPVETPLAHVYLQMLTAADDAFASVERAWLLGLVDHRSRRQAANLLHKALNAVTAQVREEYGAMARWLTSAPGAVAAAAPVAGASPVAPVAPTAPVAQADAWWSNRKGGLAG